MKVFNLVFGFMILFLVVFVLFLGKFLFVLEDILWLFFVLRFSGILLIFIFGIINR